MSGANLTMFISFGPPSKGGGMCKCRQGKAAHGNMRKWSNTCSPSSPCIAHLQATLSVGSSILSTRASSEARSAGSSMPLRMERLDMRSRTRWDRQACLNKTQAQMRKADLRQNN